MTKQLSLALRVLALALVALRCGPPPAEDKCKGVALDDGNPCTADSCEPSIGVTHSPVAVGTACSDGQFCNGLETCTAAGMCASGTAPNADDGNRCTMDACNEMLAALTHLPAPVGFACADGDACNGAEICNGSGACVNGMAPTLDDGNPCTADSCDPAEGVLHLPLAASTACADGKSCNGNELCDATGTCLPGNAPGFDDGNPCTVDDCNDSMGGITHTPAMVGTACADSNTCNGAETCNALGTCQNGTPPIVDDNNPCTADSCDMTQGVLHVPLPATTSCSDGMVCNGNEFCNGLGACAPGNAPGFDDGNPCTVDACVDSMGGITHTPAMMGTVCLDGNACNGAEGCDGMGLCQPGTAPQVNDNNPCTVDSCDLAMGVIHEPVSMGTSCSDSNACNGSEGCDGLGVCSPAMAPTIDDGKVCTADSCDAMVGVVNTPLTPGTACPDGNACNGDETCDAIGGCQPGLGPMLDDNNPCTADACDMMMGVAHTPVMAGTPCGDANACNGAETCNSMGTCLTGAPPPVDDADPCTTDSCDMMSGVSHVPLPNCVSPPVLNVPPLNLTTTTQMCSATAFLYTGSGAVQTGVDAGVIDCARAAVLRGRVIDRAGDPIYSVVVTVQGHPEFGQTMTRIDGYFDLAVNGGGVFLIDLRKDGYLAVQRAVEVGWGKFASLKDAVLVPLDLAVTVVDLPMITTTQVARANAASDSSGTRRATLIFQAGTTAQMVFRDGGTQPLSTLSVRATEYTVGDAGPLAMPGDLPANSAYTYAAEFSVDEAIAAGADTVTFSQPVFAYTDNFLGFDAGTVVPSGTYDRATGSWKAATSGRVIKVITNDGTIVGVDTDGNGSVDNAGMGVNERTALAPLYSIGTVIWRVPQTSFSPKDWNWSFLAGTQVSNWNGQLNNGMHNCPGCEKPGSVIDAQRQGLGQDISLAGTGMRLHYRSTRVFGYAVNRGIDIPITGAVVPPLMSSVLLEIEVAGQRHQWQFGATASQTVTFTWDGKDPWGRLVQGGQPYTVRVGYGFGNTKYATTDTFGNYPSGPALEVGTRNLPYFWSERQGAFPAWSGLGSGLGGWSLSEHHAYDTNAQLLYKGDGTTQNVQATGGTFMRTIAGTGAATHAGDNGPAVAASLRDPSGVAVAADGTVYLGDWATGRIRRIAPDGTITTIAGTGTQGFTGDGMPAVSAQIFGPRFLALDRHGNLYFDGGSRIRKITASTGVITTLVGNGTCGFFGDGVLATGAQMCRVDGLTVDADGTIYFLDLWAGPSTATLRKISTSGIISTLLTGLSFPTGLGLERSGALVFFDSTGGIRLKRLSPDGSVSIIGGVAGNYGGYGGDNGPATQAFFGTPSTLALGADGTIYIYDTNNHRIRAVGTDGIIRTIAGTGAASFSGDNGLAINASVNLSDPRPGIAVDPLGGVYFIQNPSYRLRKFDIPPPTLLAGEFIVPNGDGTEVYVFNAQGRHLRTVHAFSRALLYSFAYDASGRLSSVADGYGNTLTTQRDMAGKLTGFVAPGGQTTALTENANGYIASVTNPLGHVHQMTYSASGLMLTYTDPRSGVHTFTYDGQGRLQSDANPVGTTTLTHTKLADGWRVDHTSPAGRVTKYQTQKTVTGTELLTVTDPANLVSTFHLSAADAGPGSTKGTLPSGALITQTKVPDPIWKMAIPFTAREDIRLPSGLTKSTSFGRNISLANQADPLSVTQTLMVTRENLDPQRDFATLYSRDGGSAFDGGVMLTVSPLARTRVIAFNAQGRVVSDQVTGLAAEQSTYDGLGRLVARVWGGRATLYAYDMQGNLTQVSDPLARSITYAHDALGRVTVITYSDGRHFDLTLDANGNVSSATPPGSTAHTFAFDTLDSLGRYSPPAVSGTGVGHTDYAYNADEQLVTETRPDTSLIAASYDVAGRPSTVTFSSGGTFANTYAADSGFLTSISGPAGVGLAFTYDGPLLTGTSWTGDGGVNGSISRTYDTSFRPLSESVNGAHIVPFGYDRDGLLVDAGALTLGRNAQNGLIVSSAIGVSPAIATDSITYNAFAECTAYTASHNGVALYAASYSRDALGRVTQRVEAIGGVTTTYDYVYDAADRLAAVHLNGAVMPAYAYAYDANGNRVSALSPLGTVAASYDAQDRLIQQGAVSYAYSASGALASTTQGAAVTDYAYDGAGDLKSVTLPTGTVVTYIDDGLHRRVGRRVDGVLTQGFLRSGRLRIAAELDPSGAVASRFVYATRLNVPEYMVKGGNTYRIFSDDLGSPRLIVNVADGTVAQRLDYDPFGAVTNDTNPGFQPFGFAGGLYDPQTKLVRFGARDYDAQAGRWTSKDPKRFGGGDTNLYAYVRNDPVNLYDPRGREIILWQNGIHRGVSIGTDGHYVSYDLNPGSETIAATKGRVDPKNHGPPDDAEIIKRGTGDDAAAIAKAEELKQAIDSGDAFYWVANGWVGGSQGLNCVGFANAVARAGGVEPPAYFPFWDVAKKQWSSLLWP